MFNFFKKELNIIQKESLQFPIKSIIGYDLKMQNYIYFKIININEISNYMYNSYKFSYWCYILDGSIVFPKKSNCKKLFINYV